MADFRTLFGLRIRSMREAKGYSLRIVAAAVGIDVSHLSNIEKGRYSIGFTRLERLAKVLDCEVAELFEFSPDPPQSACAASLDGRVQSD